MKYSSLMYFLSIVSFGYFGVTSDLTGVIPGIMFFQAGLNLTNFE
jgi:hypothetical protein